MYARTTSIDYSIDEATFIEGKEAEPQKSPADDGRGIFGGKAAT
jgi:hypothetical protein